MKHTESLKRYNKLGEWNEYQRIPLKEHEEWIQIYQNIEDYLPKTTVKVEHENTLHNLEAHNRLRTSNNSFIINHGGSIWAMDFVPKKRSSRDAEYLAIGGYKTTEEHHALGEVSCYKNAICIWKYDSDHEPTLDMCLLGEFGIIADMKWCPLSSYGPKLGILAVLVGDGSVYILVVPHPDHIRKQGHPSDETLYLKIKKPRFVLKSPRAYYLCMSWSSQFLACGSISGSIVIWDIFQSLCRDVPIVHVQLMMTAPIRSVSWTFLFDSLLLSTDTAGRVYLHDMRDPFMSQQVMKIKSPLIPVLGAEHLAHSFFYGDPEGNCRLNMSFCSKQSTALLSSGHGQIWSIAFCRFCELVASASSSGIVMFRYCTDSVGQPLRHKGRADGNLLYRLCFDGDVYRYLNKTNVSFIKKYNCCGDIYTHTL
ncbi:hypothetical protein RMCBS344292_00799 [Rhizopus microsporus]|nr:hypothetical protein RMCBS344292_00799 [Rhizopus microsporus]